MCREFFGAVWRGQSIGRLLEWGSATPSPRCRGSRWKLDLSRMLQVGFVIQLPPGTDNFL